MDLDQSAASSPDDPFTKGHKGVFYRLLGWDIGKGESGTLERWNAGNYSTIHTATLPEQWLDLYFNSGSQDRNDYELADLHDDALSNFLKEAKKYDSLGSWERKQPLVDLPLKGVSAFSNETALLQYAKETSECGLYVAIFKGEVICSLNAETDGYIVDVVEVLSRDEFSTFKMKVSTKCITKKSTSEAVSA